MTIRKLHLANEIPLPDKEPYSFRSKSYQILREGDETPGKFKACYWYDYGCWIYAGTQVSVDIYRWIEETDEQN